MSERRACRVLGQHRSTQRKIARTPDDEKALTAGITALALQYGRYGYRRITAMLHQAGWIVDVKRVERIWRQEGLKVPHKQPKRGRLWLNDSSCVRLRPEYPNHVWSYDFVEDRTYNGRKIRVLNVIDEFTRECMIVSGRLDKPTIHFEVPPSRQVQAEMQNFIAWFNQSGPNGQKPLQALTRAAIGHLYFESIHPFEDGNGRIGRALTEKSLAQNIGQPSLISLAFTIEKRRRAYYSELERHQRTLDITSWIVFFSDLGCSTSNA